MLLTGDWLILSDRGGVGRALEERMCSAGANCQSIRLESLSPTVAEVERTIDEFVIPWLRDRTSSQGIIYLWPLDVNVTDATSEALGSVRLLADFTGAEFSRVAIDRLKESAVFDRPHLKRSAWVGIDKLPNVFYEHIKSFSRRDLPTFQTREEAMDWLVKD